MTSSEQQLWSRSFAPILLPRTINGPQTKIVYEPLTCKNILWAILGSNQ